MIESEWLNSPGPYVQYTYDVDPKLAALILRYGFAFDDKFWYFIPKVKRGGALNSMPIVKRAPLWTYPCKSMPAEKAKRKKAARISCQSRLSTPIMIRRLKNERL